ncbi:ABC transporter ATP-binding protein [Corynebacterium ulceribovis]|uniref:ABC transporter ATP-binding protein n=1 Tax=Corynebacterium ulceribovis TaxID=487732 RepID=UPI00035CCD69|nr:ABC transporter ATP-binding protein [Corynebacterium ulceribovis]
MALVEVKELSVGYSKEAAPIVRNVSLVAEPAAVTTLLGPNGCGKSTLLKTIARLLSPAVGSVLIDGHNVHTWKHREAAQRIGLLPQQPIAPEGLTVRELVARGRHPYRGVFSGLRASDREAIERAIESTRITGFVDRDLGELSGGQRQRAWLAMVLAQTTDVILLDEPTTYLDPAHALDMLSVVRELAREGKTIIMVLHDLVLAGGCSDQLVFMKNGELVAAGAPNTALTPETLSAAYQLDAEVWPDPAGGAPIVVPRGVAH